MELNIFNINLNLDNGNREEVSEFIKELSDYLEKENKNQISILEQIENHTKLTVLYRDKMYIERNEILNNYAKENKDKGEFYYIYNKEKNSNTYYLSICEANKSNVVIEVEGDKLPRGANLDTVLRKEKNKYIVDTTATFIVRKQIEKMINRLLNEQEQYLQSNRVEGHIYEVGEIEEDRVWLYDITKEDVDGIEAFEEINFSTKDLNKVSEGTIVTYINGEYRVGT